MYYNHPMLDYLAILMLGVMVIGFVALTLWGSHVVGPKRHSKVKDAVFECGIESKDNARVRFSYKYFLVAILFVLFDVEIIFFYPWALNVEALGWDGLGKVGMFVSIVLVAWWYLVSHRVFDLEATPS